MRKSILNRFIVVILTIAMLIPIFSITISALNIEYEYEVENNISIRNTTYQSTSYTVNNQFYALSDNEKDWFKEEGTDAILSSISALETALTLMEDGSVTKNDAIDMINGALGIVAVFAPYGTIAAGVITPILNSFKDPEPDPMIEYMDAQFESVHKDLDEIRGDIQGISNKIDESIGNAVIDITNQIGDDIRANQAGERVYTFMSSGQGNFDYSLIKNYLYGSYDESNTLYKSAYADKLARLYAKGAHKDDIERCYVDLYKSLTVLPNERKGYTDILRQYMLPSDDVKVKNTIQRDYYEFLLQNKECLDNGESPEWLALLFAADLQKTLWDAESYVLLCDQYFLLKMEENGEDSYTYNCSDGTVFTVYREDVEKEILALSSEKADDDIRIQMVKDIAYIMNAENSFTVEHINGKYYEIVKADASNCVVHVGQTVYMNRFTDEICIMFDLDPQKIAFVTSEDETKNTGVFHIDSKTKNFVATMSYGDAEIDTYSMNFTIYDENTNNVFSGGIGTNAYPYLISNTKQLDLILLELKNNKHVYYKLMNDLDYTNKENFIPLGYSEKIEDIKAFENVFDGNGYKIANVKINTDNCAGIFAKNGANGIIKNLNISNAEISSYLTEENLNVYIGGIAAYNQGIISNCHVENSKIKANVKKEGDENKGQTKIFLGGIAGICSGRATINYSSVRSGYMYASSERYYNSHIDGNYRQYMAVAGIAGVMSENASIDSCAVYYDNISDEVLNFSPEIKAEAYTETDCSGNFWGNDSESEPYIEIRVGGIVAQKEDGNSITNVFVSNSLDISFEQSCENLWLGENRSNEKNFSGTCAPYLNVTNDNINSNIVFPRVRFDYDVEYSYEDKISADYQYQKENISEHQVYEYNQDFLNKFKYFEIYRCTGKVIVDNEEKDCTFEYQEQYGCEGIPAETEYEDIPKEFKCPICESSVEDWVQISKNHVKKEVLNIEVFDMIGLYEFDSYTILGVYNFNTNVASKTEQSEHLATVVFAATMKNEEGKIKKELFSIQIPIVVKCIEISTLDIAKLPEKLQYGNMEEEILLEGGEFNLVWDDGTVEKIEDHSEIDIEISSRNTESKLSDVVEYVVILTYKGVSAWYDIAISCDYCDHTYDQTIYPSTCSNGGYTKKVCSKCKHVEIIDRTDILPHKTELKNFDPASCAENDTGYTGDIWCTECEKWISKGTDIPVQPHTYTYIDKSKHKCYVCDPNGTGVAHEFTSVENDDCIIYTCMTCEHEPIEIEKTNDLTVSRVVVGNSYGICGRDDEIVVCVKIFENPGITGISFRIEFDERLQFVRAERGDILESSQTFDVAHSDDGVVGFVAANAYTQYGEGTLIKLVFKLPNDAPVMEKYDIDIAYTREQFTDNHANVIEMVTMGGAIIAVDHLPGDVNSDNVLDMMDTALLSRYLSIKLTKSESDLANFKSQYKFKEFYADVDLSDSVGLSDLVMMLQFLAGTNVHELSSNQFELFLNPNNGNSEISSITVLAYDEEKGEKGKYPELPKPEREGYRFDGWYYSFEIEEGDEPVEEGDTVVYRNDLVKQVLYARWTAIYYVEYHPNKPDNASSDVKGEMTKDEFKYYEPGHVQENKYSLLGWTFVGWSTTEDGKVKYHPGDKAERVENGKTWNLYAVWEANEYKVTFFANKPDTEGSISDSMPSVTPKYDEEYTLMEAPMTLRGYTFVGWNNKKDGTGTSYEDAGTLLNLVSKAGEEVYLYAQWKPIEYTIIYHSNDGSGKMEPSECEYDSDLKLRENTFKRQGYVFDGWKDQNGGTYSDMDTIKNLVTKQGEQITLYAQWKPIEYSIRYNSNGGTGFMNQSKHKYGESACLSENEFTREGYGFIGWATSATEIKKYEQCEEVLNLTDVADTVIDLFAVWEQGARSITYNSNYTNGGSYTDKHGYGDSITIKENSFIRDGYIFAGWNTEKDGKGNIYKVGDSYSITDEVTLYAQWTPNTYYVKFNGNGSTTGSMANQTFTYDKSQNLTANAFKRVHTVTYNYNGNGSLNSSATATATFNGWAKTATGSVAYSDKASVSNLTSANNGPYNLYANWTLGSVKLPTPTRTGYTFAGWYTAVSGGTKVGEGGAAYTPSANITLYAHWTPNTYYVKFNGNGSTTGSMANQTFTYDKSQNLTANAFKRVHTVTYNYNGNGSLNSSATATATFNGWAKTATGSVAYSDKASVSNLTSANNGPYNLYANWTLGSVKLPTPTRTGYTFAGWYTAVSGGTKVGVGGAAYTPSANVTLYAHWTPNKYTVTFNANGGSISSTSKDVEYSSTYGKLYTPIREGYIFLGWKLNGTEINEDTKVDTAKNHTLVASWVQNVYTWRQGRGEDGGENLKVTDGESFGESKWEIVTFNNFQYKELVDNKRTNVTLTITFGVKEIDDGYQELYFHKGVTSEYISCRNCLALDSSTCTSDCVGSSSDVTSDQVFVLTTHEDKKDGNGWHVHTFTFEFSLGELLNENGQFKIGYGANGNGDDDWRLGATTITITIE